MPQTLTQRRVPGRPPKTGPLVVVIVRRPGEQPVAGTFCDGTFQAWNQDGTLNRELIAAAKAAAEQGEVVAVSWTADAAAGMDSPLAGYAALCAWAPAYTRYRSGLPVEDEARIFDAKVVA